MSAKNNGRIEEYEFYIDGSDISSNAGGPGANGSILTSRMIKLHGYDIIFYKDGTIWAIESGKLGAARELIEWEDKIVFKNQLE